MAETTKGGTATPAFTPPPPPPGSYDPALDAQLAAAQRGYGDLQSDIQTQNERAASDYAYQQQQLQQSLAHGVADVGTQRGRGEEDYQRNLSLLSRAYAIKANNQLQSANAAHVIHGGALLQAARKRAENEAIDRQPLDTAHTRQTQDLSTTEQRLREGSTDALGRLAVLSAPPDASNPLGGRAFQDTTTQLTRAGRELQYFGLDTSAAKNYQAAGSGWDPYALFKR